MLYMVRNSKQKHFEKGLFDIIDNHLRKTGREPDRMSDRERSILYFQYVGKALDEINRERRKQLEEEERDAKGNKLYRA